MLTLGDVISLHNAIAAIQADRRPRPVAFAFAVSKNKRIIQSTIDAFNETINAPHPALEVFNAARESLVKEHAITDAQGNVVAIDGQPVFQDRPAFEKAVTELFAAHPDATAELNERKVKADAMLTEPVPDITLHMVPLSAFPSEIEAALFDALMPMLREDEPPKS